MFYSIQNVIEYLHNLCFIAYLINVVIGFYINIVNNAL